jgi:hypothetical protein
MEKDNFYNQWKEYRRNVSVPENFASGVMAVIENQVPKQDDELPVALTGARHRLLRWCAAASLVLLGIMRIGFIAINLLRANSLVPY